MHLTRLLAFIILLTSCATNSNNYQTIVQSWQGANASALIASWGQPNHQVKEPNGNTVYMYVKQSYQVNPPPQTMAVVNAQGQRPIITPVQDSATWNRGFRTMSCLTSFEVNSRNIIVSADYLGNDCFASSAIGNKMRN